MKPPKKKTVAVPVYNAIVLMKIIGRPSCGPSILFIPLITIIFSGRLQKHQEALENDPD
jgi:hypothetical protein